MVLCFSFTQQWKGDGDRPKNERGEEKRKKSLKIELWENELEGPYQEKVDSKAGKPQGKNSYRESQEI